LVSFSFSFSFGSVVAFAAVSPGRAAAFGAVGAGPTDVGALGAGPTDVGAAPIEVGFDGIGPDGGIFIGGGVGSFRGGGAGFVLIGPDGGTFIGGGVGSFRGAAGGDADDDGTDDDGTDDDGVDDDGADAAGADGFVLIGPDGGTFIGGGVGSFRGGAAGDGLTLTGAAGGVFIGGGVGSFRAGVAARTTSTGAPPTFVGTLSASPVTLAFCGTTRAIGCVGFRDGGDDGFGCCGVTLVASASGCNAVSGLSSAGTLIAGIPCTVGVVDFALRMMRPFDHNSSV
jgi:hypothetical protein